MLLKKPIHIHKQNKNSSKLKELSRILTSYLIAQLMEISIIIVIHTKYDHYQFKGFEPHTLEWWSTLTFIFQLEIFRTLRSAAVVDGNEIEVELSNDFRPIQELHERRVTSNDHSLATSLANRLVEQVIIAY